MRIRWHLSVVSFFGIGAIAGLAFALSGPIAPIRVMGLIALTCGVLGVVLMGTVLSIDDPAYWKWLRRRSRIVLGQARARVDVWMHGYPYGIRPAL